jgi:pimeloyl-ACP methyl ester carboxylesterase
MIDRGKRPPKSSAAAHSGGRLKPVLVRIAAWNCARREQPEGRTVWLEVDGERVYATTGNRPPDPARANVVFVHGTGQDHSIWLLPARYFARHDRNVLAVDLPGHGRSGGAPLQTVEAIADWVTALLDAAGLQRAAVVGHSLGSVVALAAAARHPDRVRAIAMVAVALPMRVAEGLLEAAKQNRHEAIEMLTAWGFSQSARPGGDPTPGLWMQSAAQGLLERARPGVIYTDLRACNDYAAGPEHAAAVRCPALLILGERDRLTPVRAARSLAETLPHAEIAVLPGCGHAMLAEAPDPVLEQLIKVV